MPRIEIGVGVLLTLAAALGLLESGWAYVALAVAGVYLVAHGTYDVAVKPHFRVEYRLSDWLMRRSWSVRMERKETLAFRLVVASGSSGHEVVITRDRKAVDDKIHFSGSYMPPEAQHDILASFADYEREILRAEIRIFLASRILGFSFIQVDGQQLWPPVVAITATLAQDQSLCQQSVDETAHGVELSVIGIRAIVTRAVAAHLGSRQQDADGAG